MKKNKELNQLNKSKKVLKKQNYGWLIKITILTFIISLTFSFFSENVLPDVNLFIGISILIIFILIGIIFDMIGVASTSADEAPFHSMNSRKVKGANVAVRLIKNASKVSSFCCDVIGDICGIISGSAGVILASKIASSININSFGCSLLITSLIASLTIGGKALGKSIAINKSNFIIYRFAQIISIFVKK